MDVYLIREALKTAHVQAILSVVNDGFEATTFIDTADADLNAPLPVLVLLDINLPKTSGDEVLEHLQQSQRCKHAQVLVVSSSDAPRDRAITDRPNVVGYFKKPTDYNEFMKLGPLVRALLNTTTA
jgi:chemotaxis family two-component system response regulator Rcp1